MAIRGNVAYWQAEPEGLELLRTTIGALLDRHAEQTPDKEALVYRYPELGLDARLTYRQYRAEVERVASGLLALGIERGEHIAIWAPNLPRWIFLQLAAAKIGAVLVTVNTAYRAAEVEYVLRQGDVTALFLAREVRGHSYVETLRGLAPELGQLADPADSAPASARLPRLRRAILLDDSTAPGFIPFSAFLAAGERVPEEALRARQGRVAPDDVAIVMYTSGTTGTPKGALLSHANLINDLHLSGRDEDFSQERVVNPMPLFHIAGCVGGVLACLLRGCTLIQMIAFDPAKQLELLSKERATWTFSVPTILLAMLNHPRFLAGEFDLAALRSIGTGGTLVPAPLIEQVKARMGADCEIVFGQTESSGALAATRPGDSPAVKSRTVGRPFAHTDVKIVDPPTGDTVTLGQPGELLVRGPLVMRGYYNLPEQTARAIDAEGWLRTGDLATMDGDGYLAIVGRVKEVIIRGGENIYPAEVEQLLARHPAVAEAQVVGVPDSYTGEAVAAAVRLHTGQEATEEELRDFCRASISYFKVPRYIRIVEAFPVTASGKVRKFEVRDRLLRELGLVVGADA